MAARITGDVGRLEVAETAAQTVLTLPGLIPWYASMRNSTLALQAIVRGDTAAAGELYKTLEAHRGIMLYYVSSDRLLGILSATVARLDQAVSHFEDALAFTDGAGYWPEHAWTSCECAEVLVRRGGPGDSQKAADLLERALAIARELGMPPLLERVAAVQERLAAQPGPAAVYPNGLTQREVEVLRLVALGKSNHEIAQSLVIAEGTVRRHISNIYVKIGATNRTDATRYALQEGLVALTGPTGGR